MSLGTKNSFGSTIIYNAICASCSQRYIDHDIPLDGWIEVKRCDKCLPMRISDLARGHLKREPEVKARHFRKPHS